MSEDRSSLPEIATTLGYIVRAAGQAILQALDAGLTQVTKEDGSPCTNADLAAEAAILARLRDCFPDIPLVSEESTGPRGPAARRFFLVDPLDGTRDFLAGRPEFTVNIGLIDEGRPIAGAIYAPLLGHLWIGGGTAKTAIVAPGDAPISVDSWQPMRTRRAPTDGLVALESRSHRDAETDRFLTRLPLRERRNISSSIKFCLIAAGEADVYARFGPTMEWDTAAGEAILRAAGGIVTQPSGEPTRYGQAARGFRNEAFLAWGDPDFANRYGKSS